MGLLACLGLNAFFLFKNFKLQLPDDIQTALQERKVKINKTDIETRFLPTPHLLIKKASLKIQEDVSVELNAASIHFDIIELAFNRKQIIEQILIDQATVRVLDTRTRRPAAGRLKRVLGHIERLMGAIPARLNMAKNLYADTVHLVVEDVSKTRPLLTASQIHLQDLLTEAGKVKLTIEVAMSKWLKAHLQIDFWPNENPQKDSWVNKVDIYLNSNVKLDKLPEAFDDAPDFLSGNVVVSQFFSFSFPIEKAIHSQLFYVQNLKLKAGRGSLTITPEDNFRINFSGLADLQRLTSDSFSISVGDSTLNSKLLWVYKRYLISLKFEAGSQLRLANVAGMLPFPARVQKLLKSKEARLQPSVFKWQPWKYLFRYRTRIRLPLVIAKNAPYLSGSLKGRNYRITSKRLTIRGNKTSIGLTPFKASFSGGLSFNTRANGNVYLEDFTRNARGKVYVSANLNCKLRSITKLDCRRAPYFAHGEKVAVRAGFAARMYRFLSLNFFSYWKSLKPDSEIVVSTAETNGYFYKENMIIKKTTVASDVGNFGFSGSWAPLAKKGDFKLRMIPLGADSILKPIPLVGKALNESLAFAAQMIFSLSLSDNKMKIKSFTFGKGMEKFKNLFRKT